MYTHVVVDVSVKMDQNEPDARVSSATKTLPSFSQAELQRPSFSFDIMELYVVADYLDMPELTDLLCKSFFESSSLFSVISHVGLHKGTGSSSSSSSKRRKGPDASEMEGRVAKMLARCNDLRSPQLLVSLASAYANGTAGLRCLCTWPTKYPRYACCVSCSTIIIGHLVSEATLGSE